MNLGALNLERIDEKRPVSGCDSLRDYRIISAAKGKYFLFPGFLVAQGFNLLHTNSIGHARSGSHWIPFRPSCVTGYQ